MAREKGVDARGRPFTTVRDDDRRLAMRRERGLELLRGGVGELFVDHDRHPA
jgi:hypothetical protein